MNHTRRPVPNRVPSTVSSLLRFDLRFVTPYDKTSFGRSANQGLKRFSEQDDPRAVIAERIPKRTHPGQVLSAVGYRSPEQVRGQPADARSDIVATGAIRCQMFLNFSPTR